MSFATSCVVALTFLVLGIFVFWRLPSDSRAVIFFVMTLVAAVTLASTAVLQAEGSNMRGIVSAQDSFRQLWEVILLLAAGVFFAPLLLHLALIFPKERPVIARRPYIFRWVYGVPIGICVYALFLLTTFTALENRVVPKDAARIFAGIVVVAAIAACVALIGQMVRKGFLEGFLTSPIPIVTLIDTTFLFVLVLGGRNAALTKSAIPFFAHIMVMV